MEFDKLFEKRSQVAVKLKDCIRDMGYTKISFAKKADISRPTLDRLLKGEINNKTTFDRHMQKILKILGMSVSELMMFAPQKNRTVSAVYSQNAPTDYEMSSIAKKQYALLMDIVELCDIYY